MGTAANSPVHLPRDEIDTEREWARRGRYGGMEHLGCPIHLKKKREKSDVFFFPPFLAVGFRFCFATDWSA